MISSSKKIICMLLCTLLTTPYSHASSLETRSSVSTNEQIPALHILKSLITFVYETTDQQFHTKELHQAYTAIKDNDDKLFTLIAPKTIQTVLSLLQHNELLFTHKTD